MQTIYAEESLDGKIILMHSIYESSLEAVRELVPYLIENGYQLVTVSDHAKCRGGAQPGQVYHSFYP